VKVARKHISWYTKGLVGSAAFRQRMNQLETVTEQRAAIDEFFGDLAARRIESLETTAEACDMKPVPECRVRARPGRCSATLERYFHDPRGPGTPTGLHALVMDRVECELIRYILTRAGGNQTLAAQMLGINRNTLRRKIQQYQLG